MAFSDTLFHVTCKEGHFDAVKLMVNNQFQAFWYQFNAQHVNGFDTKKPPQLIIHHQFNNIKLSFFASSIEENAEAQERVASMPE